MDNNAIGQELESIARKSWKLFVENAVAYILGFLVLSVLGAVTFGILAGPLAVGYVKMVQKGLEGQEVAVGDIFAGFDYFGTAFVAALAIGIGAAIGFMILFLPGMAVIYATMFVMHAIVYEDLGVAAAFRRSFEMIKGNWLFCLIIFLVMGAFNSLGSAVAVGVLLTGPLSLIALTLAYQTLAGPAQLPEASEPESP